MHRLRYQGIRRKERRPIGRRFLLRFGRLIAGFSVSQVCRRVETIGMIDEPGYQRLNVSLPALPVAVVRGVTDVG